jgi:hypothetical protein
MMIKAAIFIILIGISGVARADSSCWLEEKMVGRTGMGYVLNANFHLLRYASVPRKGAVETAGCSVDIFDSPGSKTSKRTPCGQLQCINGSCGDDSEETALPVEAISGSFVQILLQDGRKAWLKFQKMPKVERVLAKSRTGNVHPENTPLMSSPYGAPFQKPRDKETALKVIGTRKVKGTEWADFELLPVINSEPPVQFGPALSQGAFLFRAADGRIQAVVAEAWCD